MKGERIVPREGRVELDRRLLTHWEGPRGPRSRELHERRRLKNRIKRLLIWFRLLPTPPVDPDRDDTTHEERLARILGIEHDPWLITRNGIHGREAREWYEQRRLKNRIKRLLTRLRIVR